MQLILPDLATTEHWGRQLANTHPSGAVVYLHGELGTGKSTLARAFLRQLGVTGTIRSPTYTLTERYSSQHGEIWHLDLYRIVDVHELEFLGLDEGKDVVWLVEWPDHGLGFLPEADLHITLSLAESGQREAVLQAGSVRGRQWLDQLTI